MENIKRIFLIDDDTDDQLFFKLAVAKIDPSIICQTAKNGQEAIRMLKEMKQDPNLIFLDLNMPLMDGFECLHELKKNRDLNAAPIIIFSTSTNHADVERAKSFGASGYLNKPNDNDHLEQSLREILTIDFDNMQHRFLFQ